MISISLAGRREPEFQRRFGRVAPANVAVFAKAICTDIWSPIVWKEGVRSKAAFESCAYVVLDFDSGTPTLAETRQEMVELGLAHILATTKSHQKEKTSATGVKSAAVDRYRLVLKAPEILDRELYEWNMAQYASWFGADPSCTDAARFYYPCIEVIASCTEGMMVPWQPFDDNYEPEEYKYARRASRLEAHGRAGTMPGWMVDVLDGRELVPEGGRHTKCVAMGAQMARMGISEEKIVALLLKTRLADIGEADVRRAVRNGIKAELG